MELFTERWRRPLIMGSGFLLLAGITGAYYANEADKPPVVLQEKASGGEQDAEAVAIIGLQEANEQGGLRNPFTLLHEREGEVPRAAKETVPPPAKAAVPVPGLAAAPPTPVPMRADSREIQLCGIIEGEGGRLALLQAGGSTAAAGVGETVAGWQVTDIGRNGVTVQQGGQMRSLSLSIADMGAK